MSGVHLFSADQMAEGHRKPGGFVAVCGEVVGPCSVPHRTDTDPTYCPACVREAARWNAEAGDRASRAPDPSAQAARDDAEPRGYYIGQCGHRAPLIGSGSYVGPRWDLPNQHWRQVNGDTTLHPGVELIDSSGHPPGHQSVLVRLPRTGPVLLAGDAIAHHDQLDPDNRVIGHHDHDETEVRASTRKLVDLATAEGTSLIVHSHDREQWPTLRHAPPTTT